VYEVVIPKVNDVDPFPVHENCHDISYNRNDENISILSSSILKLLRAKKNSAIVLTYN